MTLSESQIQQMIQIEGGKQGVLLMRNNSGAFHDDTGRVVRYGLGNVSPKQEIKSSDLIGITTITITSEMVGRQIGVFTAIEVKKEGWEKSNAKLDLREEHQQNFLSWVKSRGGIAAFADSVESFKNTIASFLK